MKHKKLILTLSSMVLFYWNCFSQTRQISGKVTSAETNETIPFVIVRGGGSNATSDVNGMYQITVADTAKQLTFTITSYQTKVVKIEASNVIDVVLTPDAKLLDEAVVSALGIVKQKDEVNTATQKVEATEMTLAKGTNFTDNLAGRAAGVNITRSNSGPGGSNKIVLRGNKSIQGNNQALIVIDGIPMSNAIGGQPSTLYDVYDGGDAISNLNPEDIEEVNVLKGAGAAALYGSQAANGVIIITTKKGKGGPKVNFSSVTTFEKPIMLPKIQTSYGPTNANSGNAYTTNWGPKGGSLSDAHISDFYNTGSNFINSISLSNSNENTSMYLSYANTKAQGIVPDNKLNKHNFNLATSSSFLNNKLTLDGSVKYISQQVDNRPSGGYYLNPLVGLYLFPVGKDINKYNGSNFETNDNNGFPVQNWLTGLPNDGYSYQNPYWVVKRNTNSLHRNRSISAVAATYSLTNWLKVQARVTHDRTNDNFEQKLYGTTDKTIASANGEYTRMDNIISQTYTDLLLNFNKDLNDQYSVSGAIGTSYIANSFNSARLSSYTSSFAGGGNILSGLYYQNVFTAENLKPGFDHREVLTHSNTQAVFGTATFGYKKTLFLDLTARNEWASTIPNARKSPYFYPSVGLSYVLTKTIGSGDILNYAKLRVNYANVGNALPVGAANSLPPFEIKPDGSFQPNLVIPLGKLVPERTKSFEGGFDSRLFKDHVYVNFTYYNLLSTNQLFTITGAPGSGSAGYFVNGGDIRNSGFELSASYRTKEMSGFSWETAINTSRNVNKVINLSDKLETDQVIVSGFAQTKIYDLVVKTGGSYGDMYGLDFERENGKIKVDNGKPVAGAKPNVFLGNPNPKLLLGWQNSFKYKDLTFRFLIDCRFGGKVVSITEAVLDQKGLSQRSADARDAGSIVVEGVSFDPEKYYTTIGGTGPISTQYVYDATNIRMREMSLSYSFKKIKGISNLSVSLVGRNLFFLVNKAPFDPDAALSAGNGLQGLHAFNLPTTRSYGINFNLSF